MITKVSLRNFKGIVSGDIELSPLTIIVGPNNSGKTSILEALLLSHGLGELFNGLSVPDLLMELHRILDSKSLKHLIHNYGSNIDRVCVGYHINGDVVTLIMVPDALGITFYVGKGINADEALKLSSDQLNKLEVVASITYDGSPRLTSSRMLAVFLSKALLIRYDILKIAHKYLYRVWEDLTSRGLTSKVAKWISETIDEDFTDLTAEPFSGKPCINLYRSDRVRIRLGDLGDGIHMLVISRLLIEYLNPDLILWDDIELHVNPLTLTILSEWLSDLVDSGKQVVVTTHSLEVVRALVSVEEKARVVGVSKKGGVLRVKYYSGSEVEELKELGFDIRT